MQPLLFSLSPFLATMVLIVCSANAAAEESSQFTKLPAAVEGALQPGTSQSASAHPGELWKQTRTPIGEFGQPVDPGALGALRGGYDAAENSIDVDGTVDGNTANGVIAGANTISDGAFAHASGLSTVIQNSGSNVLIQNAMIVKVDFGGSGP